MQTLTTLLKAKIAVSEKLMSKAEKQLRRLPTQDTLRTLTRGGHYEYYVITKKGDHNGVYTSKKDPESLKRLKALAQRDYARSVLALAEKWRDWAKSALETMPQGDFRQLHQERPARAPLIEPYLLSPSEYTAKWLSETYRGKGFAPDTPEILTDRNERVRSKSEKMIADRLNQLGIPYKYERPLHIGAEQYIYPDFTLLDPETRNELYLEHFGMMDNGEYGAKVVEKMNLYASLGIFPGKNLIILWESRKTPLNLRYLGEQVSALTQHACNIANLAIY